MSEKKISSLLLDSARHFDLSVVCCLSCLVTYDVVPGGLWSVRLPLEKATGTGPMSLGSISMGIVRQINDDSASSS